MRQSRTVAQLAPLGTQVLAEGYFSSINEISSLCDNLHSVTAYEISISADGHRASKNIQTIFS